MTDHVDPHDETPSAPFRRVLSLIDGLPERFKPSDDTPLREAMPGGWPTIGEFRSFMGSAASPAHQMVGSLEEAIREFMPLAEVAFLWTKETPPAEEVDRYREAYWKVRAALSAEVEG